MRKLLQRNHLAAATFNKRVGLWRIDHVQLDLSAANTELPESGGNGALRSHRDDRHDVRHRRRWAAADKLDLSEYRTVAAAIKTTIKPLPAEAPRIGYLGVVVSAVDGGSVRVDEVEEGSPAGLLPVFYAAICWRA